MPLLQYDIAVVGMKNVEKALAGIEKRFVQHNRTLVSTAARTANTPVLRNAAKPTSPAKISQELKDIGKGYAQIARVGMMAERQRHTERMRNLRAEEREARRAQEAFRRHTRGTIDKVTHTVGSVGKTGLTVAGLTGAGAIASRVGGAVDLERRQRQVIINARGAGKQNPVEFNDLQKKIQNTSIATGVSMEDVTGGLEAFVQRTGDLPQAVSYMDALAKAGLATGSSMSDLANVAADLQQKFDIKDPKEMADALAVLAMQGKKGAFELRDMATTFPDLAAAAERVGMKGGKGMRTLGGLAQIARTSTGSGEEASTALQAAFGQIVAKGADLESGKATGGHKVKVFTDKSKTQVGDIASVIANTIAGTQGNLPQLEEIFDKRGIKAMSPLISTFTAASQAAGGGEAGAEAGRKAIIAAIDDAANAAGTFADLQRDAADMQKSASVQLEILNTRLTAIASSDLLPALQRLGPHIERLIPPLARATVAFTHLLDFFMENPFAHIGEAVLAKIVFDIEKAAIGNAIKDALTGAITGGGGGTTLPGTGGGGPKGRMSKILELGRFLPVAGVLGDVAGEYLGNVAGGSLEKFGGTFREAVDTETAISKGGMSPEELTKRRDELRTKGKYLLEHGPTTIDKLAYKLPGSTQTAQQAHDQALNEVKIAIGQLNAALQDNTEATRDTKDPPPNRSNSPAVPKGAG